MGATGFDIVVRGNKSQGDAYASAVDDAVLHSGNDPYNGTISTTRGVQRVSQQPMTLTEAQQFVNEFFNGTRDIPGVDKWGNAGAIQLLASTGVIETRTKKVTLDAVEYTALQQGNQEVVRSELRILKGYELTGFRITDTNATVKVDTKATDGERETRYFIEGPGFSSHNQYWDVAFPSQAAARAFLDEHVASDKANGTGRPNQSWGIYAVTRRSDGSSLVRSKRFVKRAVLTVEYTMEKRPLRAKADGWLFFGWAAS